MARALPPKKLRNLIQSLSPEEALAIVYDWSLWARDNQRQPDVDWYIWLLLSGRGGGKTRVGSETIIKWAREESEKDVDIIFPERTGWTVYLVGGLGATAAATGGALAKAGLAKAAAATAVFGGGIALLAVGLLAAGYAAYTVWSDARRATVGVTPKKIAQLYDWLRDPNIRAKNIDDDFLVEDTEDKTLKQGGLEHTITYQGSGGRKSVRKMRVKW